MQELPEELQKTIDDIVRLPCFRAEFLKPPSGFYVTWNESEYQCISHDEFAFTQKSPICALVYKEDSCPSEQDIDALFNMKIPINSEWKLLMEHMDLISKYNKKKFEISDVLGIRYSPEATTILYFDGHNFSVYKSKPTTAELISKFSKPCRTYPLAIE